MLGYATIDWGGRVWFYYHPDKTRAPDFELPSLDEYKDHYIVSGTKRDVHTHAWESKPLSSLKPN